MNPRDAEAYIQLGRSCRGQGRGSAAEAALQKALELDPQGCGARIELGALYEDQNRLIEAAAEFARVIAIDPDHGGAHCELGRAYRRLGRVSEAEAVLRTAIELSPQDGRARFEMGALYRDQGRFVEAAAEFEGAIALDPDLGWAHCELGRIYRRQGRSSEAEAALRKALEIDQQNSCARFEMGALYQDRDRCPEAAAEFERAIAIDPNHGGTHCQLGRIYRKQGRRPEAEAALRKARELDPENGWVRFELGALCRDQGRFVEAAAEFEGAIALDPDLGEVHCELGRIYRKQGRSSEAEAEFEKAMSIDPHNADAPFCLGLIHLRRGRWAAAEAAFQTAIAIAPCNGAAHFQLGDVYRRQRRWRDAEAEFKEAVAIEPKDDRAYMGLWAIYRSQGRATEAEAASQKASAMNPRNAWSCGGAPERPDRNGAVAGIAKEAMRERVFCMLPWTCLHAHADGALRPCYAWNGPSLGDVRSSSIQELRNAPGMKALRSDMMSGRPVEGCSGCYENERAGFLSKRQRNNIEWAHHRSRERLTAPDGTLPRLPVPFLDIRFSNVCNLRCRTCGPVQSSAWAADARALGLPVEGGPILKSYDDWDVLWRQLQPLLEEGLEEILFAGGEPLIMEECCRILDILVERKLWDVRLRFVTNFSTLRFQGRDMIGLWSRFRNVQVAASLDGSGRRGEYLRHGLLWDTAVANREEMLRRCPDVAFSIHATLSIFNALHLPDFHREWVEKGYIDLNGFGLNMLLGPEMYRAQVLPEALKRRVLESYRRHQESFLDADGSAARDFAAAASFLQEQDRSGLLPEFVAMTRRLDQLRREDCREVFPELAGLFEAA